MRVFTFYPDRFVPVGVDRTSNKIDTLIRLDKFGREKEEERTSDYSRVFLYFSTHCFVFVFLFHEKGRKEGRKRG